MLLIILIIIGLLYYNYLYLNYLYLNSSEDEFHKTIHKDVNNINDSPIVKFKFDNNKSYNIAYNNLHYNEVFARHDYDILLFKPCFKLDKNTILSGKSQIMKYKFNKKKKKIILLFNHYYLGGNSFLFLKAYGLSQRPIDIPENNIRNILFLPKLLIDYNKFINSKNYEILPRNANIKRYSEKLELYFKNNIIKKRTFILYKVIKKIYKSLNLNRAMRVMIPVPFKRINEINNNIGVILLLFNGSETLEEFNTNFENKKYMAHATNIMLITKINKLFSNNVNLRKEIDAVVTCIYSNKKDDYYKDLNYSMNWTTKIMPLESVYTAVYFRIDNDYIKTNITYTVSTSQFKKTSKIKKYNLY